MATTVPLTHEQGTTFKRVLTITDDATPTPNPIDLTGYIFRSMARIGYDKAEVFAFAFSVRAQTGANIGKVDMSLLPSDTSSLVLKSDVSYVYDVEMESPSGDVKRLFQGSITVSPEATK